MSDDQSTLSQTPEKIPDLSELKRKAHTQEDESSTKEKQQRLTCDQPQSIGSKLIFEPLPHALPVLQGGPLCDNAVVLPEHSRVKAEITQILLSLQQESTDLRKMELMKLKDVLRTHRAYINDWILAAEVADPVIHQLVKALLTGSRDAHDSLKVPYAECIGELGAIDPSRLGTMDLRPNDMVEKDETPTLLLASAAYRCKSYARSLLFLEKYLRIEIESEKKDKSKTVKSDSVQQHLSFLQSIYSGLDEPDELEGCSAMRINATLDERITDHEQAGHWSEALVCYNMALQGSPNHIPYCIGILNCLRNLGRFDTLASEVQGLLATASNHSDENFVSRLPSLGVQAAWRLSNWTLLDEFVAKIPETPHPDFEASVGKIIGHVHSISTGGAQAHTQALAQFLAQCRTDLMASLGAASMESYHEIYPIIVKLHLLHELEQSAKLTHVPADFKADWESRMKIIQPSFKISEPILSCRRLIFSLHNSNEEVGRTWLQIGKLARISNQFQTATNIFMKASLIDQMKSPLLQLESAKLLHKMGDSGKALSELQELLRTRGVAPVDPTEKMVLAKVHILVGKLMEETGELHSTAVIEHFRQSTELCPMMEKGHFCLALYYDKFVSTLNQGGEQNHVPIGQLEQYITYAKSALTAYGNVLKNGHAFLYQSLPRLLTIWFELGTQFNPSNHSRYNDYNDAFYANSKKKLQDELSEIHGIVNDLQESLPAYLWYTSFLQLTSRIVHETNEVWDILRSILCKVLLAYPQQGLWAMLGLSKSTINLRQSRTNEVIRKTTEHNNVMSKLQDAMSSLIDKLVWLSNIRIPTTNLSLDGEYKRLMNNSFHADMKRITPILVPLKSSLTFTLPASGCAEVGYQAFATNLPTIVMFRDNIEVLGSVQQPKKVIIVDSTGKETSFLCKPEDDIRKDVRMMEFNTLVNQLLKNDPASRRRNLNIRTYAVTPLNEKCGLIEWVPNTSTFKSILGKIYKDMGVSPMSGLKPLWTKDASVETYVNKVLPCYPPRFHVWFEKMFHNPCSWFEARRAYCGTLAVMSMVGFVVGLGDRHGENILFDMKTGEAVHVDFNCLFWKGLSSKKPEKVPFRLTHNLVDAMGLIGFEGSFKKACEITLALLRANKNVLLCVLHSFINDPLALPSANEHAVTAIKIVERRLMGYSDELPGPPLSVVAQVCQQIQEATSTENLSQMYMGWAPWL